jgi:NADP-dependent 3-hydroxy acid dehydrogenase YdfG
LRSKTAFPGVVLLFNKLSSTKAFSSSFTRKMQSRYYNRALELSGARVLITGATSGIGRACAFRFQELNCQLILVGRDEAKLNALGQELAAESESHQYCGEPLLPELVRLDVTDIDKIHEVAQRLGPVDILINNAGTNLGGDPADKVRPEDMQQMVFTNYIAPMTFVSAFAPMMKRRGAGHIINICSTAANDTYPNGSVYCSTKAALSAYTVAARHDLVDTPVRITSISPGLVDTPLHEKKVGMDKARAIFDGVVPLFAEDIADQIIYVSTRPRHVQVADLSSYATNQSHSSVDGIPEIARVGPSLGKENVPGESNYGSVNQWPLSIKTHDMLRDKAPTSYNSSYSNPVASMSFGGSRLSTPKGNGYFDIPPEPRQLAIGDGSFGDRARRQNGFFDDGRGGNSNAIEVHRRSVSPNGNVKGAWQHGQNYMRGGPDGDPAGGRNPLMPTGGGGPLLPRMPSGMRTSSPAPRAFGGSVSIPGMP